MISFDLDKETSFHQTIEPTYVYNNTIFYTMEYFLNYHWYYQLYHQRYFDHLDKIYGGVDILLIFMYACMYVFCLMCAFFSL